MIVSLLALLLLQAGQPVVEDDAARICTASATGQRHARVDVSVEPRGDGDVSLLSVGWSPPRSSRPETSRPDIEAPRLRLYYEYAEADNIAEISDALGIASSTDAPDGAFNDMALAVRIDQGDTWYVALESIELDADRRFGEPLKATPSRDVRLAWLGNGDTDIDVLGTLQAAHMVTLSVVNRKGHPIARISYDLSATTERDRLFRTAWKKAHAMARQPQRCPKAPEE